MREISFRVYVNGEMLYLDSTGIQKYDYENGYVIAFSDGGYEDFNAHEKYDIDTSYEIMQFTSLLDKNDTEIFEKDIIDIHQTVNGQSKFVIWSILPKLDIRYAHDIERKYEYDVYELIDAFTDNKTIEVIGNIHEHKHLL